MRVVAESTCQFCGDQTTGKRGAVRAHPGSVHGAPGGPACLPALVGREELAGRVVLAERVITGELVALDTVVPDAEDGEEPVDEEDGDERLHGEVQQPNPCGRPGPKIAGQISNSAEKRSLEAIRRWCSNKVLRLAYLGLPFQNQ